MQKIDARQAYNMWPADYGFGGEDRETNHTKIHRRASGSGLAVALSFLISIIVLFGLICSLENVQCVIQQQEQSPSGGEPNSLVNNDIGNGNQVIIIQPQLRLLLLLLLTSLLISLVSI